MIAILSVSLLAAPPAEVDAATALARWHAAAAKIETLVLEGTQITVDHVLRNSNIQRRVVFRMRPPGLARMDVCVPGNDKVLEGTWIIRAKGNALEYQWFRIDQREVDQFRMAAKVPDVRRQSLAQSYFVPDPALFKAKLLQQTPGMAEIELKPPTVRSTVSFFGFFPTEKESPAEEYSWSSAKVWIDTTTWFPRRITLREAADMTVVFDFPKEALINEPLDDACFQPSVPKGYVRNHVLELPYSRSLDVGHFVAAPVACSDAHQVDPAGRRRAEPLPVPRAMR